MTGDRASVVFGETLCLPTGRQGGTFFCLTAEKHSGSTLASMQGRLSIRVKTRHSGVRRRLHMAGRHSSLKGYHRWSSFIDIPLPFSYIQ